MARLELENIYYRYKGGDKDVLRDINCIFEEVSDYVWKIKDGTIEIIK